MPAANGLRLAAESPRAITPGSRRQCGVSHCVPIWAQNSPPTHITFASIDWGAFGNLSWGLAMGQAHPSHSRPERGDGSQPGCDGYSDDEPTGDVVSMLEENARLRSLVVKLSEIILRNVVDRG
jgi:hypothetical protein